MNVLNFGSLNIDFVFHVAQIVRPGQTVDSLSEGQFPGGKGLNQSIALARAGIPVFHGGLIGPDGEYLRKLLENDGVDCRYLATTDGSTGRTFIQVDENGQNSIVLSGGANRANTPAYCDKVLEGFGAGDLILLQNEINCLDYLVEQAAAKGMIVALNPSPMNEAVRKCDLSKVSIFIMNEDEGCQITGKTQPREILEEMGRRYPNARVFLTLGAEGSYYAFGEEILFQPAFTANAVDTTGAGDTFTGYLLAGLVQGDSVQESMGRAAQASAIAVTRHGAASSIPWCRELEVAYERCRA